MKETIITVMLTMPTARKSQKVWWDAVFAKVCVARKWRPIVADGIFTIASEVGSFNLNNRNFASVMTCDLEAWREYRAEFKEIVKAIDSKAKIIETEIVI